MDNQRYIPWRKKFKAVGYQHQNGGWSYGVYLGLFFVSLEWKCVHKWGPYEKVTGIYIGLIPFKTLEGQPLPCKSWTKREPLMQEVWNG